jgi:hypothetical protein
MITRVGSLQSQMQSAWPESSKKSGVSGLDTNCAAGAKRIAGGWKRLFQIPHAGAVSEVWSNRESLEALRCPNKTGTGTLRHPRNAAFEGGLPGASPGFVRASNETGTGTLLRCEHAAFEGSLPGASPGFVRAS